MYTYMLVCLCECGTRELHTGAAEGRKFRSVKLELQVATSQLPGLSPGTKAGSLQEQQELRSTEPLSGPVIRYKITRTV